MKSRQGERGGGQEHLRDGHDPRLNEYLTSADPSVLAEALRSLLEIEAAPIMRRLLQRHGASGSRGGEAEEVMSATREQLIVQLTALRSGERATPIRDFHGYVAAVTYSAWAAHLRDEHPQRSMLTNRLRYLLENRTKQRGFALWNGPAGERWCGFARWRDDPDRTRQSPKLQWLMTDPIAAVRQALGHEHLPVLTLPDFVAGVFAWLGGAIELKSLVEVTAEVLEISDRKNSADDDNIAGDALAHPGLSPLDALKWREYLGWLWCELARLSLPQRTAFLLHSDLTIELDFAGVASIREISALLELPAEEFAALWNLLPLDDLTIGGRLSLQRQQIINLRRVARDRLGAAWEIWSA